MPTALRGHANGGGITWPRRRGHATQLWFNVFSSKLKRTPVAMSHRIPIVNSNARRLWAALALALTSGCMTESLSPQREQGNIVSPQRKQGSPGVARWTNPWGKDTAVVAANSLPSREARTEVVQAKLKLPDIDPPADPDKKPAPTPEPHSLAALLSPVMPPAPAESPIDLQIALSVAA